MTPLRLFELIFGVLVDMIVGYAKLYSHRKKVNNSFEITNEKIHLFLGICYCLVVPIKLLDRNMYWEAIPDTFVKDSQYFYSIPRNRFERILRNLHPCGKKQLDNCN